MAISVTCPNPKCLKRFKVSDQFAGKTGPCPSCKTSIQIPLKDNVTIHAPEGFGPKDAKGRAVLKPVFRQETKISLTAILIISLSVVVSIVAALVLRSINHENLGESFPYLPLVLGAVVLSAPLVFAGYTFLRDQELEPHLGQDLWIRTGICALIYALLWLVFPVCAFANNGDYSMACVIVAMAIMIGIGGAVSQLSLELEYLIGVVHFGLYFIVCVLLRWIATGNPLPFAG